MARAALGVLGWTPDAFRQATPAEFRLACEGRFPQADAEIEPILRRDLDALMQKFPDKGPWDGHSSG